MEINMQDDILRGIRELLTRMGRAERGLDDAQYVLEAEIDQTLPLTVDQSRLVSSKQFYKLMPALEGGADWIHANLYFSPADEPIIGLARGALCGNPAPTLNFSVDKQTLHIRH